MQFMLKAPISSGLFFARPLVHILRQQHLLHYHPSGVVFDVREI
jgi:hypothetical protein